MIKPHRPFNRLARLNIIPDIDERMAEIATDPVRLGFFLGIRMAVGEGNDQFVDDMYATRDGRLLVVSRPSLADVVGIRIRTGEIAWRFPVEGQRSDHMALSPDGKHVAVSASTGNLVHILDVRTGEEVGRFPSGDSPHENVYSASGRRIFHASIGLVYTPADQPAFDSTKGERYFQVVDARTNEIRRRIDMGEKLEEAGYPDMSSAVRPMTFSPNERFVYFQVSFFHGFIEYDLRRDRVRRVANLPIAEHTKATPRDVPARLGAPRDRDEPRWQAAVRRRHDVRLRGDRLTPDVPLQAHPRGGEAHWSTNSGNGRFCFVSWAKSDRVSVIS